VTDRHVEEALAELLVAGGPLTKTLLGVAVESGRTKKRKKEGKRAAVHGNGKRPR
jgi:hypothetical protein